jgi:hypothetical protein
VLLLTKCYPSLYTKVKGLIQELEKLNIKDVPGKNISTLVQEAPNLIREIQMNFLRKPKDQITNLCVCALQPFKSSSHEYIKHDVTDKMFSVNKLIMAPYSSASLSTTLSSAQAQQLVELNSLVLLQGLKVLYITLKQQNNYSPGEQISSCWQ